MDKAEIQDHENRIEAGDETSLVALWESGSLSFSGSIAARVINTTDREDVRQETFLNVLKAVRAKKFKHERGSFSTWTKVVANNVSADFRRREKRKNRAILEFTERCVPIRSDHFLSSNTLSNEIVHEILSKMKEKDANLLRLTYINLMPLQATALLYGIPLGTVKSWLFRAKGTFRTLLIKKFGKEMEDAGYLR